MLLDPLWYKMIVGLKYLKSFFQIPNPYAQREKIFPSLFSLHIYALHSMARHFKNQRHNFVNNPRGYVFPRE